MKICEENKEMAQSAENFATLKLGTAKNGWKRNKIDEKVDKLRDMHGNFGTKRLISSLFVKISQISLSPGVGVAVEVVRKFTIEQLTLLSNRQTILFGERFYCIICFLK